MEGAEAAPGGMESIPSASYSFTLWVEFPHQAGTLGKILIVVGDAGALVGAVDIVRIGEKRTIRNITVNARDSEHAQQVIKAVDDLPDVKVINVSDRTFLVHLGGKIEVRSKMQLRTRDALSMVYTSGVARVSRAIAQNPERAFNLTHQAQHRRRRPRALGDGSAGNHLERAAVHLDLSPARHRIDLWRSLDRSSCVPHPARDAAARRAGPSSSSRSGLRSSDAGSLRTSCFATPVAAATTRGQ